ncbi:hypothetical protein Bhyg_03663 [Pseudolycoriella hygida]|uniref:IgA peptidase M64 n=1 Tax=Pseudolycoriella hygida TaxID=35572 RepID=A0A9Q0NDR2_9DIPT|nr:hypothetical protein Bhyg_03663 [Pseudolycoriella hygida]
MKYIWLSFLLVQDFLVTATERGFYTKLLQSPQDDYSCLILEENVSRVFKGFETSDKNELKYFIKPALSASSQMMLEFDDHSQIIEVYAKSPKVLETYTNMICKTRRSVPALPSTFKRHSRNGPEIEKIINGGHQDNRIDVVFMGDGYTADERDQFFDDIRRLTNDMFNGDTFRSYLPVFNIWAVYVESAESGIGYDGAKDTAFRLYRSAGQLRGIYTGNATFARQICQLTGPNGCDYPSLIANDDYYGGLGGEFVISTKSNRTGTVVLRHEMGHNFIRVGEEYDDGSVYDGVNSASSLPMAVTKWGHWLSTDRVREERAIYRLLEYPWADLSLGEQTFTFTSDGQYSRWYLDLSVSAAGEADSLEFELDGKILPWQSRGSDDREFYDWFGDDAFSAGVHTFSVRSKTSSTNPDIPRMICSITLHEFGNEEEYEIDNDFVSAYPTWDSRRRITYRPTNAGCLMRNMTHNEFCPVCKEGMWYQFFQRISLIDGVSVSKVVNPDKTKRVVVNTLKLGQLREIGTEVEGERLEIRWYRGGVETPQFKDQFEIDAESGSWSVSVRFYTPEVRYDPDVLLRDTETFTVTLPANSTLSSFQSWN